MRSFLLLLLLLSFARLGAAQEVFFQTGHTNDILEVRFSPDDTELLSYSAGDGRMCLWEVRSGRLLWMTETSFVQRGEEAYRLDKFYWSDDGRLFTTSANGTYQTWDAKTGKVLSLSETKPEVKLISAEKKSISFTQDYRNIRVLDSEGKVTLEFRRFGNNSAFDTSHDGTMMAEGGSWGDASIRITNVRTGKSWWLDGHPSIVKAIAYSPDGKYLAVGGSDKNIYIFDAATRALWKTLKGHNEPVCSIAFSPDGRTLVSSSRYESVKVWDWQEGRTLRDLEWQEERFEVTRVSFSTDGKALLTMGDEEKAFKLWDARSFKLIRNFKTAEGYSSTSGMLTMSSSSVPVLTAQFIEGGRRILSTHRDGTLRVWETASGRQLRKIGIGVAPLVEISPDSKTVLAAVYKEDELQLKLFDLARGTLVMQYDDEDTAYTESLVMSADGRRFASSDVAGDCYLWDVNKRKPVHALDVGFSGDDALAFSRDGQRLVIGGKNQNLFIFDTATGRKLWQLIPSYEQGELEARLVKEKRERWDKLRERKDARDKQAEIETKLFKKQVYITFEHYGEMTDPMQQRLMETGEPDKSRAKSSKADANAVWLRLHNDSPLPISIPTLSMYLRNPTCFFQFPSGAKSFGLCPDREISVWFGLEDKEGKPIPSAIDSGSSAVLLPKQSVLFAVPRAILKNGNAIVFDFNFLNEADDREVKKYGEAVELKLSEARFIASFRLL
jgi:WD40 repeat protein